MGYPNFPQIQSHFIHKYIQKTAFEELKSTVSDQGRALAAMMDENKDLLHHINQLSTKVGSLKGGNQGGGPMLGGSLHGPGCDKKRWNKVNAGGDTKE